MGVTNIKNSFDLERILDSIYRKILNHDKIEIDNPNKCHPKRLNYIDRLNKVISIIKKRNPIPYQVKVGDFASGQGNIGLILAELGYEVYCIDINPLFIEYSKMKYEKGKIQWICSNINNLNFPNNFLDVAVAGELIEHCAYPEDILKRIINYVKPGGILVITTPNGSQITTKLPKFRHFINKSKRKKFEEVQFGPDGEDHLFLFNLKEIELILPNKGYMSEKGYLGGLVVINRFSQPILKFFPSKLVERCIRGLSVFPLINRKISKNIYIVIRKRSNF